MYFDELNIADEVLDGLDSMNFVQMTPIQESTIPLLLEGKDMIACAQTGTGKTAAYLLPIIDRLSRGEFRGDKVNAVIMAPTRELAVQIEQQVIGFSYFLPISCVAIYGGTDGITWEQQRRGLELGVDIVIATPGRLLSLINLQHADLSEVSYFVLDEADRMLDMGFLDDIKQIHKELPLGCQTVMFSATMPPKIKRLAETILHEPSVVEIAISRPPESIKQMAYVCYEGQKLPLLLSLFDATPPERTIVFASSKLKVKELSRSLRQRSIKVSEMHSDLDQSQREMVMREFRSGAIELLVATDIVARGIDIDNISLVINYDTPRDPEDYVHRIGRTARGESEGGQAITFVSEVEQYDCGKIESLLGKEILKLPIPEALGQAPDYQPERSPRGSSSRGRSKARSKGRSHAATDAQRLEGEAKRGGRGRRHSHPQGASGDNSEQTSSTAAKPQRGRRCRPRSKASSPGAEV